MITFTRVARGAYDATTDSATKVTTTVTGHMMKDESDPDQYRDLGLVEGQAITMIFVPLAYGGDVGDPAVGRISVGDTCVWPETVGPNYTAKAVDHLEPDGYVILTTVVLAR